MNRRGQAIVESVLILALFVGISTAVGVAFKENELLSKMVASPWQRLAGMLQNGQWTPINRSSSLHPSIHARHISVRGDPPQ
ncbi:MAG: hypothetical protein AB7N80_05880 [Bdellovibrionales bacterium]